MPQRRAASAEQQPGWRGPVMHPFTADGWYQGDLRYVL
jgi:hypothetical protein